MGAHRNLLFNNKAFNSQITLVSLKKGCLGWSFPLTTSNLAPIIKITTVQTQKYI